MSTPRRSGQRDTNPESTRNTQVPPQGDSLKMMVMVFRVFEVFVFRAWGVTPVDSLSSFPQISMTPIRNQTPQVGQGWYGNR